MKVLMSLLLIAVLCLVGCSQSQLVTSLQVVVDAAEIAFPIIAQQANLPVALTTQVEGYLKSVDQAVVQAAPILASTGTAAQKTAQITAIFAKIVAPSLPPGTPQNIVSAVSTVAEAVANFLSNVGKANKKALSGKVTKPISPSLADSAALAKIEQQAKANLNKFK